MCGKCLFISIHHNITALSQEGYFVHGIPGWCPHQNSWEIWILIAYNMYLEVLIHSQRSNLRRIINAILLYWLHISIPALVCEICLHPGSNDDSLSVCPFVRYLIHLWLFLYRSQVKSTCSRLFSIITMGSMFPSLVSSGWWF